MAAVVPAPSTIVVLSLSMVTFLALPRSSILIDSSLIPRSSVIARPLVRIAMSSSIALRRSPKPGALTAAAWSVPRSLLAPGGPRAPPVDVSRDDQQRAAEARHLLEHRQQILHRADFLLVNQN